MIENDEGGPSGAGKQGSPESSFWLFIGGSASSDSEGTVNIDRRGAFGYDRFGSSRVKLLL